MLPLLPAAPAGANGDPAMEIESKCSQRYAVLTKRLFCPLSPCDFRTKCGTVAPVPTMEPTAALNYASAHGIVISCRSRDGNRSQRITIARASEFNACSDLLHHSAKLRRGGLRGSHAARKQTVTRPRKNC